jgi:Ca-activated chloride channel homolog
MKFAQPIWLIAGLIASAALLWRYRRFDARQRSELAKFASESLLAQLTTSVSSKRRYLKRALVVFGVACVAVALARPLAGFRWQEANRKGLDLLFAVDTSKSMLAQDVKPDRITRAKMAVEDLLARLDGDRAGLIAFAGNAFLQCPLTLDYDAFRQSLDALDTKIIPRGGTDIAAAIHEAEAALEGNGNNQRILILLTDGEDLEGNALEAARAAARKGLKIFTVGVGTVNGELVPLADEQERFAKDGSGQFVKSRLDESMLKQIAEATGAMYQPLGQQAQGLDTIYQQGLAHFTRHKLASRMQKVFIERFQWPLALGLICLVLEPLIGTRRRTRSADIPVRSNVPSPFAPRNKIAPPRAAVAALFALLCLANSGQASPRTGEKAFQKGDYAKAEREYRDAASKHPDQPVLQFNRGSAAYKTSQFDVAAQSFSKAMKTDDLKLQQDNHYNFGNTQYRIGQKNEKANAQETIKSWEQAVQSYEAALKIKPDDADAKYNRDLVKRKLEELKKQQQQKQQQQDQKNNQQQNQDKNQQDKQDQKNDQHQNKDDSQQNQQPNKDQNKSGDKKDQQDQKNQQSGGSGQPDKQDQKKDKDQAKNDKDQSKPGQQPDQQQNQKNGGSDQPDKQDQANKKPEDKNENGESGQKPEQAKKDGQPKARNAQPAEPGQDQAEADARPEPGKMSREEARQLLDSLKSGDRKMPLGANARGNATGRNDEPLKDW